MPVFITRLSLRIFFPLVLAFSSASVFALNFSPGNIYGSQFSNIAITEYDGTGAILSTLNPAIDAGYTRGMTFGPDGLLYIVAQRPNNELFGFSVYALDEAGVPQKSWTNTNAYIGGNIAYGKIAFAEDGHFYVGSGAGLHQFNSANQDPDSLIFSTNSWGALDVDVLPNGEIIVASNYDIFHLDSSGNILNAISGFSDPSDLNPSFSNRFTDIRSLAYDAGSNTLLVYHIGHSSFFHQIMRVSPAGELLDTVTHAYALDLAMLPGNNILAGSWVDASAAYASDLSLIASSTGPAQSFFAVR